MRLDQPFIAAAAQISPVFMKKKESIEKYAECLHDAGRQGVDLVVTPETGIPTYPYWRNNFGYTNPENAALWKDTVVASFGAYVTEPVFHREALVVAELDPKDRIVAKNVFDCMGTTAGGTWCRCVCVATTSGLPDGRHRRHASSSSTWRLWRRNTSCRPVKWKQSCASWKRLRSTSKGSEELPWDDYA